MKDKNAVAAESWKKTISGIPTLPGRLEYLASLRNAHSGCYEHFGLAQRIGENEADLLLRRCHEDLFQQWLRLDQQAQKAETEDYLDGLTSDKREIISNWLALSPFEKWMPADSRDIERKLFLTDVADVLESIRSDYRVACRDPGL